MGEKYCFIWIRSLMCLLVCSEIDWDTYAKVASSSWWYDCLVAKDRVLHEDLGKKEPWVAWTFLSPIAKEMLHKNKRA